MPPEIGGLRPNTAMKLSSTMDGAMTERLASIREDPRRVRAWQVGALAAYGQSR